MKPARLICIVLLVIAGARVAAASELDDKAQAKAAFIEARRLYDVGEYKSALASFKTAYLHYEDPSFLFNIAQCHRQLGEKVEALKAYKSYLTRYPNAPNRGEVQKLIALLQTAIADDARAKQAPPPPENIAPPAEHHERVKAAATTATTTTPATTATPATTTTSPVKAAAAAPQPAETAPSSAAPPATATEASAPQSASAATEAPTPSDKPPLYKRWWLWTAVAGAVVVGTGVGLGVYYGTRSQFDSTLPGFGAGAMMLTVGRH